MNSGVGSQIHIAGSCTDYRFDPMLKSDSVSVHLPRSQTVWIRQAEPVSVPLKSSPFPTLPASFSLQQNQTSLKQVLVTWTRYFQYYQ